MSDDPSAPADTGAAKPGAAKPPPPHLYFYGRRTISCVHDPSAVTQASLYWCSNFFKAPITIDEVEYDTVEHYYQAEKFSKDCPELAERIRRARTPTDAKKLSWKKENQRFLRSDWEKYKVVAMRTALRAKFTQHPDLARKLIATAPAALHEDAPTDKFWGVAGVDMLGRLLTELRDEL